MSTFDFASLFYSQVRDRDTLLNGLDSLLGTEAIPVTMIPYACESPPTSCLLGDYNRDFSVLRDHGEVALFELTFRPPRTGDRTGPIRGKFFVVAHPVYANVYIAMTIESLDFVRRALLPFFEQHQPHIYLTFLKHADLQSLMMGFKERGRFSDLRVVRASLISRFMVGKGEMTISSVSWPRLGLEGAFHYAQEQNGWFRSLTFEALQTSRVMAETTIRRDGIVKTDGLFLSTYTNVVLPICKSIKENIALFEKRGRRENPHLSVRPLMIEFGQEQFENVDENAKFIEAMRLLDNASVSVVHGNPYIALSVVDYFDGSAFDLWVLSSSDLVIVPQLKSSVSAIKRLISHVFDNYAEGIIKEFPRRGDNAF